MTILAFRKPLYLGIILSAAMVVCAHHARAQDPTADAHGAIQGRIVDDLSTLPVALVRVNLGGTSLSTLTGGDGRFELPHVPPGTYTLTATRDGYYPLTRKGVSVATGTTTTLQLLMTREMTTINAIVVTPGAFSFMDGPTLQTMSREDIEDVPQLGEDLFRAIDRLPGLSSGDYTAHFSIRGGRYDETLIQLDNLELYEPYHLKDFDEGATSIFDVAAVENVELMTGGFSAQYGDRRSGVLNITSRSPDVARGGAVRLGVSLVNAQALAMGPLADGRGSWVLSARSGYLDLIFGMIKQADLPSPRYHDIFGKLAYELNSRNTLTLDLLHAGDKYEYDAAATTGFQDTLKTQELASNSYGNSYIWTTLTSRLGDRTTVNTLASAGLVTRDRSGYEKFTDTQEPLYEVDNQRDFSILGIKQDWTHEVTRRFAVSFGADARRFETTDSFSSVVGQDPNDPESDTLGVYPVTTTSDMSNSGTRLSLYLSNRIGLTNTLILDAGLRYDNASWTADEDFSPRVNMAFQIKQGLTLRAGWGYYRQIHAIDDLSTLDANQTYYPSELTELYTAGIEQVFHDGTRLRLEAYLKDNSNLRPRYRNWKGGIDTFPESNEDRILVYPVASDSKGVELYFDRPLTNRLGVRASYSYSIANETVSRMENVNAPDTLEYDATHPIPQDQRHAANLDMRYRVWTTWILAAAFSYHSGWPATPEYLVDVVDDNGDPQQAIRPGKIYGTGLPDYLRLDVRLTKRWTSRRGDFRFYVEIVNITNHENVFGYDSYATSTSNGALALQNDPETWFTILPSLGIAWSRQF